jgi:hypothetical protein
MVRHQYQKIFSSPLLSSAPSSSQFQILPYQSLNSWHKNILLASGQKSHLPYKLIFCIETQLGDETVILVAHRTSLLPHQTQTSLRTSKIHSNSHFNGPATFYRDHPGAQLYSACVIAINSISPETNHQTDQNKRSAER